MEEDARNCVRTITERIFMVMGTSASSSKSLPTPQVTAPAVTSFQPAPTSATSPVGIRPNTTPTPGAVDSAGVTNPVLRQFGYTQVVSKK